VRVVSFGRFAVADTGYHRFTLRVTTDHPAPLVDIRVLELSGPASAGAQFNQEARRNAASVHLRFPTDSSLLVTGHCVTGCSNVFLR